MGGNGFRRAVGLILLFCGESSCLGEEPSQYGDGMCYVRGRGRGGGGEREEGRECLWSAHVSPYGPGLRPAQQNPVWPVVGFGRQGHWPPGCRVECRMHTLLGPRDSAVRIWVLFPVLAR